MENHFQFTDYEFENQFEQSKLAPELFSHEAHLRLAWIHVTKYGLEKAIEKVNNQIINYVSHLGAQDKYNMTLTIAAVKVVYHFVQKSKSSTFQDFINEFPRLKNNFKDILAFHYGIDIFHSTLAKTSYLEPDLLAFN